MGEFLFVCRLTEGDAHTEIRTLAPITLIDPARLADGSFRFSFTNTSGATFTALATTDLSLPLANWTVLGPVTEISPGQFQFTDPQATTFGQRFYGVRSP